MNISNFQLESRQGHPINCIFKSSNANEPEALLIFVHGFKGFMNWGGFPYLTDRICEPGLAVACFDLSMNGVSPETPMDFNRLDLFAQNTHTIELEELGIVIDHFISGSSKYNIDRERIALMGHSRGGGTVILKASSDPRIKSLISLASISTVDRYTEDQKKRWKEKGYIEIPNTRTNQMMRMNYTFLEDIESNRRELDITEAAGRISIPWLIIHGREDLAVKHTDALELFNCSVKEYSKLLLIENTGHTFGVEHPFKGTTGSFETVISASSDFLKKNLISS